MIPLLACIGALAIALVGCRKPTSTPTPTSRPSPDASEAASASGPSTSTPCTGDHECGAGLVCFRRTCQTPVPCDACPADAYCDARMAWCQSCPAPTDGPVMRDFDFEGLRYHVEARREPSGENTFLPAVEISVTSADGQRHGVHRASAFTHGSHTDRAWGTLGANAPRDGVPDTCVGPGDTTKLAFDLSRQRVEVHAGQKLEVTYGVLTGDCTKIRARVHVVSVRLDWSCKTPAFWISDGPEKPVAAEENRK